MEQELKNNVRTLTTWLGQIIQENEGTGFFKKVEQVRLLCKEIRQAGFSSKTDLLRKILMALSTAEAHTLARAFTLYFQLVNLAEEHHRVQRLLASEKDPQNPRPMSVPRLIKDLHERKVQPKKIQMILNQLRIEPVLTAHPTEAKRKTVLTHLDRLRLIFEQWNLHSSTWWKQKQFEEAILEILEMLWQTKQVRDRKIRVEDEIQYILNFFKQTIFSALEDFHSAFKKTLSYYYPTVRFCPSVLTFGSWVGGDRDGNPLVRPKTSLFALQKHRGVLFAYYQDCLNELFRLITSAKRFEKVNPLLEKSVQEDLKRFPFLKRKVIFGEPGELYRMKLHGVWQRLERTHKHKRTAYQNQDEFIADLKLLQHSLRQHHGHRAANGSLQQFIDQVTVYGFHLARLDFRQHAERIRNTVIEILGQWPEPSDWPKLVQNPPSLKKKLSLSSREILEEYRTQKKLQSLFGPRSSDHTILSMTHEDDDIWAALLLARYTQLMTLEKGRWTLHVDVVPLFETIPDLRNAQLIMRTLWKNSFYRTLLQSRGMVQEIMLGYSDSNKSGGYLSANYELHRVQQSLAQEAKKYNITLRLFHGKGGSIDRGGGPSHRAVLASPDSVTHFQLRITEQGEVISHKYGHPVIAKRNFEQMVNAVVTAGLFPPGRNLSNKDRQMFSETMMEIVETAYHHYRTLVYENPDFQRYFLQATPIDLIQRIQIASRPAFRNPSQSLDQIRAIPWVFAWTQSRHLISAWYGMGTGFNTYLRKNRTSGERILRRMYTSWPFFSSLIDNAQLSLAKTDMNIARHYASLVSEEKVRESIFGIIENEYDLSVKHVLKISGQKSLLEKAPVLLESIRLRNPYIDPLNFLQVEYLKLWRSGRLSQKEKDEVLVVLLMTVNGIAFGMKGTG